MNRPVVCLLIIAALCLQCAPFRAIADDAGDATLVKQRAAFRAVRAEVERGNWLPVRAHEELLKSYVLWPDLRATYLRATLDNVDHGEIDAFLDQYGVLKPARELRYQYVLHLARENRMPEFLAIYQQFYQGLEIAKLDCLALRAEIDGGQANRIASRARILWLVGKSQSEECDPVFDHLRNQQLLTADDYIERFNLAVQAKQFSLAKYLAGSLDAIYLEQANEWLDAQKDPARFVTGWPRYADTALSRKLFAYAVERLAVGEPLAAHKHWRKLATHFSYDAAQINSVSRHIALWAARGRLPEAEELLSSLPAGAHDAETGRWLVRSRLLRRGWQDITAGIDALQPEEGSREEWQYWKAVALQETGRVVDAHEIFRTLAGERSYYGFLAADAINAEYALNASPVAENLQIAAEIAKRPELIRARELFLVGLEGRGRSEWDSAIRLMTSAEQAQAALLADSWGWHSRAIATVAVAGEYDDLRIRYPLPWRDTFEKHAVSAGVTDSWAYGIARSESLFMRDIRSSAGAIGVMQLMPATGRSTAREIRLPWSGQATLTDSSSNIRLGTQYLGNMFSRFDENRVLATAAYNAGPHRVEAWLPESGTLDARIWIENIPYNETRGYVRKVLADDVIFNWRMTGKQRRLSEELLQIAAPPGSLATIATD